MKLARHTRAESVDELRHAELLTNRILFLDGLPNYQRLFPLRIGQTITQMLQSDMAVETEVIDRLRRSPFTFHLPASPEARRSLPAIGAVARPASASETATPPV